MKNLQLRSSVGFLAMAVVLSLTLVPVCASAATADTGMSMNEAAANADANKGGLTDIIVTARKQSERLQDIPVAVTAIKL